MEAAARGIRVFLVVEAVFGPLVGAATLAALARIRRGEPATYWQSMLDGLAVWPRIFMAPLGAGAPPLGVGAGCRAPGAGPSSPGFVSGGVRASLCGR